MVLYCQNLARFQRSSDTDSILFLIKAAHWEGVIRLEPFHWEPFYLEAAQSGLAHWHSDTGWWRTSICSVSHFYSGGLFPELSFTKDTVIVPEPLSQYDQIEPSSKHKNWEQDVFSSASIA